MACEHCDDEEYHLWEQELAVVTRRRPRGDGTEVDAFCLTSLAPHGAAGAASTSRTTTTARCVATSPCACQLGRLGLRTRIGHIRGISKVVAAGVTLEGETFDELAERRAARPARRRTRRLPVRRAGRPDRHDAVALRIHPRVGDVDEDDALVAVRDALAATDNGLLASAVWGPGGGLRVERAAAELTKAGKLLAYERIGSVTTPPS